MSQERIKKDYPKTFTRNMERLQELQPKLAEKIYDFVEEHGFPQPSAKETSAGIWCSGLGERPFFQPHLSGKTFIPQKKRERPRPVVLIYGAGFPPYLVQALRSIDKSVLAVIVFEPSLEILVHTLATSSIYDALPQFARISFVVKGERSLLNEVLGVNVAPLGTFPVTKADVLEHSGEKEIFSEEFIALSTEFRNAVRMSVEKLGNTAEDTLIGVRNICLNAPWIWQTPPLNILAEKYEGLPVITVASGPSLEKNFRLLRGLEKRCLIICADTALPKLLREDIIPHIVITLERPFRMYLDYFRPLYEKHYEACKQILLIAEGVSPSQTVGRWPGAIAVVGKRELPLDQWIVQGAFGGNMLFSGASVMHVALSFTVLCKPSSIAMIGQDLAYSKEGASHSNGTLSSEDERLEKLQMETETGYDIPGMDGETVRTSISWLKMLQIFEDMIPFIPAEVFDCTEGGARIEGTTLLKFEEYIEQHIPQQEALSFSPCLQFKGEQQKSSPGEKVAFLTRGIQNLLEELKGLRELVIEIEEFVKKASSPGLKAETRRNLAFKASEKLDAFHQRNGAVAFLGQSYAHSAGTAFSLYRFMERQEEVEAWQSSWEEVLEAYRVVLGFLEYWFRYAFLTVVWYGGFSNTRDFENVVFPCSESESTRIAEEIFDFSGTHAFEGEIVPVVTSFLSRSDAAQHSWSPAYMWRAALYLEQQGRCEQASLLMEEAASFMEGMELPRERIGIFFMDCARIMAKEDLCYFPNYRKALSFLRQAEAYFDLPDLAINELSLSIRDAYSKALLRYKKTVITPQAHDNPELLFQETRINIEQLLVARRLDLALREVWTSILTFAKKLPHCVVPQAIWLINLLPQTVHAQDEHIREASFEILGSIKDNLTILQKLHVQMPLDFALLLEDEGISFIGISGQEKQV